jgi:hypothetical protein
MYTVGSVLDSGRASAGGAATLTDATKVWGTNLLAGCLVQIYSGTGVGQVRKVTSNTATVLTMTANWTTNPDATSEYVIFPNMTLTTGDISLGNVAIENAAGDASAPVSSTNGLAVYLPAATVTTLTPPTAAAIAAADPLTVPVAKTLTVVTKAVTTAGTGVPLVATETFARKVYLNARKATGANTGMVYIGTSAVDMTTDQQMALAPGDAITIDPGPGCKIDLNTIYIDCATSNTDGVTG